jgi:hypothetical protein
VNIGDLVKMRSHDTGLVGVVVDIHYSDLHKSAQVGIRWLPMPGKVEWEPERWLEVVSAGR